MILACSVFAPKMVQVSNRLLDEGNIILPKPIHQSLTDELKYIVIRKDKSSSPDIEVLLKHLSFTHFAELVKIDNP